MDHFQKQNLDDSMVFRNLAISDKDKQSTSYQAYPKNSASDDGKYRIIQGSKVKKRAKEVYEIQSQRGQPNLNVNR